MLPSSYPQVPTHIASDARPQTYYHYSNSRRRPHTEHSALKPCRTRAIRSKERLHILSEDDSEQSNTGEGSAAGNHPFKGHGRRLCSTIPSHIRGHRAWFPHAANEDSPAPERASHEKACKCKPAAF